MRAVFLAAGLCSITAAASRAEVEELFSRHIRVLQPKGDFAKKLIKAEPPEGGDGWHEIGDPKHGFRILVPARTRPDQSAGGSCVLRVALSDSPTPPRPLLRIDVFRPQPGEPESVDADYAAEYARQYPEHGFRGRFSVTDSGFARIRKQAFAFVGGAYTEGGARAYRLQWVHLAKDRQLFVTFDCAEDRWPEYADTVARVMLGLKVEG